MRYFIYILFLKMLCGIDFSIDISPIIYNNCTNCHRTGQIASFLPLTNYNQVHDNRYWISDAISGEEDQRHGDPIMPPWPADREYSTLLDEMYLTESQINVFNEWIETGSIQGDPNQETPMPEFPEGSNIGVPDMVFEMESPYSLTGNYQDDYRCFIIDLGDNDEIDIAALEFIPGNLEAVHHAILVAVPDGSADNLDQQDSEYGYECFGDFGTNNISDFLGGYAPGTFTRKWPEGMAQKIPENSDLILQIHYAPLYDDAIDQSYVNIFEKDEEVDRYINEHLMINFSFQLPPNEITEVSESWYIGTDISLIQFLPHSHLLGKSWEIFAIPPNSNDTINIIRINDWDFDWQFWYSPPYMIHLVPGTVVHAKCLYDNTSDNPNNPNSPPQWVHWGDGTTDEMFFVPFRYVEYQPGDEYIYLGEEEYIIIGDLNNDGMVNILDVINLANAVLSQDNENSLFDINEDGYINILDIISLVNIIFS